MTTAALRVTTAWWRRPADWPAAIARVWSRSLQFRTVVITVCLSGVAILVTGLVISYSVGSDLYNSRLEQALRDASRAQQQVQATLDATDASDPATVLGLGQVVQTRVQGASSSRMLAFIRKPGQAADPQAPTDYTAGGMTQAMISPQLAAAVAKSSDTLYSQSVALPVDGAPDTVTHPGVIVGAQIQLPTAGTYQIFLGYDLSDAEQTLNFVQRTLVLAGVALIALIGAVTFVVVRFVVAPIQLAAVTSRRLAAGDLEVRIPENGQDVFTTLARSFNAMADSLQQQITQLATLSQLQQRFVSDVSHELRTPLTTIRLASEHLYDRKGAFDETTSRTAELLHAQVQRFDLLLSDLLEISRYDAGSVSLEIESTSVVKLAEDAIEEFEPLAHANGTELRLSAPGGYSEVPMDARRVRRVIRNLLGNAIEHGEGKPIDVIVDSNSTAVALAVRDHGMGMSESDVGHVFDRFWRADPSRRRTIGGTGLGLAISQEDALIHGGVIDVWSRPGEGSCFRLTLPRGRGAVIAESPIPLQPADAEGGAS
ncbi:MtrAB system histidine kinase MtrB [Gryllotalpicola protaetiae]|uniref:Sensor histidine kinase MtrB n=1 Tax=Gryllotalpicola protaetiae TaxID=2419771 RepID=A0A387BKA8_9MICO|nr:MtrAB system histidine kinase MtrB [Gryllotalpicola protaetiae]AYG04303.1 sensor histidine kinase [Gryllotalpicola protaetiae]